METGLSKGMCQGRITLFLFPFTFLHEKVLCLLHHSDRQSPQDRSLCWSWNLVKTCFYQGEIGKLVTVILPNLVKVWNVWFLSPIRLSPISQANQEIQLYQILVIGFWTILAYLLIFLASRWLQQQWNRFWCRIQHNLISMISYIRQLPSAVRPETDCTYPWENKLCLSDRRELTL